MSLATPRVEFIAGVVDARAHIEVNNRHGRPQPRLRITTARVELLDFLAGQTGTTVRIDDRGYYRRPCSDHCSDRHSHVFRQSAYWTVDSARATIVLAAVVPFLVAQRVLAGLALTAGLAAYPPAKGDTAKQMARLGWELPDRALCSVGSAAGVGS